VRPLACLAAAAAALLLVAGAARAEPADLPVPLPRGSRMVDERGVYQSGKGFKDTVQHVARRLGRAGVPSEAVPVYQRRGVTVARFLARGRSARWSAIHVWSTGGRTYLFVVPAAEASP
jgi:hypothetical protein